MGAAVWPAAPPTRRACARLRHVRCKMHTSWSPEAAGSFLFSCRLPGGFFPSPRYKAECGLSLGLWEGKGLVLFPNCAKWPLPQVAREGTGDPGLLPPGSDGPSTRELWAQPRPVSCNWHFPNSLSPSGVFLLLSRLDFGPRPPQGLGTVPSLTPCLTQEELQKCLYGGHGDQEDMAWSPEAQRVGERDMPTNIWDKSLGP